MLTPGRKGSITLDSVALVTHSFLCVTWDRGATLKVGG